MEKMTITRLKEMKEEGKKIVMLTCYDYPTALIMNEVGIDILLVGDSLGMVVLGYEDTLPVTMEDMIRYTQAVARGNKDSLLVTDMPFLSYEASKEEAIKNAGRLIKEAGAQAVKTEGGKEMAEIVKAIVDVKIPVMGHIGLTPQSVHKLGGFKVQGKTAPQIKKLIEDAQALEEAGVFSIVLECVPAEVARMITERVKVPTIGIGAGPYCDGQVLVTHDLLGLFDRFVPKFVKQYADLRKILKGAFTKFKEEVGKGEFPTQEHSFKIKEEELNKVDKLIR
jgi:3-methyl-2-oxobutanoate hydroxymethyltransferase